MSVKTRAELRQARHQRIRKRVFGTAERPRLAVFRSLKHISAQIIDDTTGVTLASAGTLEKGAKLSGNQEGAREVGERLAQRALEKNITKVVLDRGGCRYHGRIASLAEGARAKGLEF